jgi:cell division transport system permease protein
MNQVQIDLLWIERLTRILALLERFTGGLAVLLVLALLLSDDPTPIGWPLRRAR